MHRFSITVVKHCIILSTSKGLINQCLIPGRGESKRHAIRALSEPYPLVTIRARKMSELKVPINADKGSH